MSDPTDARLHLLSLFQRARDPSTITAPGWRELWLEALGEDPADTIRHLMAIGHLDLAPIAETLGCVMDVPSLKNELRARGLKVSGRKADLVTRLHDADLDGCGQFVKGRKVLVCTAAGREAAERYDAQRDLRRQLAEAKIIAALREHRFEDVAGAAYVFNKTEVFAPGVGFTAEDILEIAREQLPALYDGGPPAIVGDLAPSNRIRLLDAAGLCLLGFHEAAARHLPKTDDIGSRLRTEVAVRMCVFAASHRRNVTQIAAAGCKTARIGACSDCCPECATAASRTYRLSDLPELPLATCSSDAGCRCRALAEFQHDDDTVLLPVVPILALNLCSTEQVPRFWNRIWNQSWNRFGTL